MLTKISIVIPVRDEESALAELFAGIEQQQFPLDEIVIVDGGSTDQTFKLLEERAAFDSRLKVVSTMGATPGKGRNIGIEAARNEWIALTDAGIILEPDWLQVLVEKLGENPNIGIIYGDYAPVISSYFEKIAALSYVGPKQMGRIRGPFIASSLLSKTAWRKVGGFPDWRAAEDLSFMEALDAAGIASATAPKARVHWKLRPDLGSTIRKFVLYSKHNIWAGRQWDWHYGILRQYVLILPFVVLGFFHSWFWFLTIPIWTLLRAAKRIVLHRQEFGLTPLVNLPVLFGVAGLIICIDLATFIGWAQAYLERRHDRVKTAPIEK